LFKVETLNNGLENPCRTQAWVIHGYKFSQGEGGRPNRTPLPGFPPLNHHESVPAELETRDAGLGPNPGPGPPSWYPQDPGLGPVDTQWKAIVQGFNLERWPATFSRHRSRLKP
jgi:hypothetical protein